MTGESRVSVVVPVTGVDAHPKTVVEALDRALRRGGQDAEFVLVLDGPVGAVEREIESIQCSQPLKLVRLQGGGLGESIALSAGVDKSAGRWIVNVPAYLQSDPEDVLKVIAALEAGADCVATWRNPRVDPWLNRLQSRFFNWLLRLVMGMPFHDLNSGTRGFRKQVLEEVSVYGELYRFLPVLALRQGFRVVEVKVRHVEERGRRGFYGVGVYLRRLLDILAISFLTRFTQQPLRFFGYIGFLSTVAGVALTAWPLYEKLFENKGLTDRPMFMIGAIVAAFGVQLVGFGLVGEIIIFTQAQNLRDYKVEEIVEGDLVRSANGGQAAEREAEAPPAEGTGVPAEPREDGQPLRVRELLAGEDSRWDAFVGRHPLGTFFHLSGWRRCISEVFRHEPTYLVAEQGRRWVGVLPLFLTRRMLTRSPFLGRNLVSVPYAVYGGVLADSEATQQALLDGASAIGRERHAGYVELRHLEPRPGQRPCSPLYVTFRKDLPEDPAAIAGGIPKRARAEVRRAREKHRIELVEGCDLELFYALFAENKRRLGSPALPRAWFRMLVEEFGRKVVLHRAVDPDGRTLAAVMSFTFKDTVSAYYSGSLTGVNDTGVNDFIYCGIMEWAVRSGYARFDFGRSRVDSGPAHFKKNMGFVAEPLHYEYVLLAAGARLPEFHPGNPRLYLPQRLWSKLPLFIANRLGSRLSRYLP